MKGPVAAGRLLRGGRGFAGEIAHLPLDPAGPSCACGHHGCLSALVGLPAVVRRLLPDAEADGPVTDYLPELTRIVDVQLARLLKRLTAQGITLQVDDPAKKRLAEEGYDPQFGARPLKRAIQDHLLNPLAQRLLAGDFKSGDIVKASAGKDGELTFTAG